MTLVEMPKTPFATPATFAPLCRTGEDGLPRVIGPFAVQHLLGLVAAVTRVKASEMRGLDRNRRTTRARQIFFFLARETTRKSYPLIGEICRRDHSTVMYGHRKVKAQRAYFEPELSQLFDILKERAGQ